MTTINKRVISLLGCGWVGLPLAKSLVKQGFTVRGTTTRVEKMEVLKNAGIDPYLVQFYDDVSIPDLKKFFKAEILIITIPPARRNPKGFENYKRMVRYVIEQLANSEVSKIILLSSTSVYADANAVVDEFSETLPNTESGQIMLDAESQLSKTGLTTICLRLAGLIGPGRLPGNFFAGKTQVPNGLAPVNLVHLDDVIGIINKLIVDENSSGIYNGCAPSHPTRQEFYTLAAEMEGLKKPDFISEKLSFKIVSSVRLKKELNYNFEVPSLMNWLGSDRAI